MSYVQTTVGEVLAACDKRVNALSDEAMRLDKRWRTTPLWKKLWTVFVDRWGNDEALSDVAVDRMCMVSKFAAVFSHMPLDRAVYLSLDDARFIQLQEVRDEQA